LVDLRTDHKNAEWGIWFAALQTKTTIIRSKRI
jgi:hypothetical protein